MRYFIVDAFTDQLFGGNPAGVVLLESERFHVGGTAAIVAKGEFCILEARC